MGVRSGRFYVGCVVVGRSAGASPRPTGKAWGSNAGNGKGLVMVKCVLVELW